MNKKDIKILLVDDEPDILEIVGYNLRNEGYQIFTAENGQQAIKSAKKNIPHLILLDIMMPEMDGIEATRQILSHQPHKPTIVALTANATKEAIEEYYKVGMKMVLIKPVKMQEFQEALKLAK